MDPGGLRPGDLEEASFRLARVLEGDCWGPSSFSGGYGTFRRTTVRTSNLIEACVRVLLQSEDRRL